MLKYIAIALLFISQLCFSKTKDCVVLHKGDTLYGKYIKLNGSKRYLSFRTNTGKIKIPVDDIKEFYRDNRKYRIYNNPCEGGLSTYIVLVEGKASLLHSGGYEDFCPQLVLIEDEVFPIERHRHLSEEAWSVMSKSPAFREKYNTYYYENLKKSIFWEWAYRKSRMKLLEMIRFYNKSCG